MKRLFVTGFLFVFMAVAPVVSAFAAEPEVVTNSGPISSVTVAGLVAQNGTPTPNTPVAINTNNGVVKVSKNLFSGNYSQFNSQGGTGTIYGYFKLPDENSTYTISLKAKNDYTCPANVSIGFTKNGGDAAAGVIWAVRGGDSVVAGDIITKSNIGSGSAKYPFVSIYGNSAQTLSALTANFDIQIEQGSTATEYKPYGQIYADGEVETIADSANHTATVATLLGVGDYRDTQNINTGAITRNIGIKVLDGTENWNMIPTAYADGTHRIYTNDFGYGQNTNGISTHFVGAPLADRDLPTGQQGKMYHSIQSFHLRATQFTSLEVAKQWLAAQYAAGTPVIVIYPLATPTTESVAGQTMTTAPVNNRAGGVAGMTITTLLSSGASVVTTIAANAIKIATTAYNAARFNPVKTDLNSAVATIREIVTKTINQTAAIASLQADKQTRPEDACPAGKKCLLVETEENGVIVPHWFPIIEAPE